jgi:hypothetical protein
MCGLKAETLDIIETVEKYALLPGGNTEENCAWAKRFWLKILWAKKRILTVLCIHWGKNISFLLADLIIEGLHDSVDENTHKTSYFTNNSEIGLDTAWSSAQQMFFIWKKLAPLRGHFTRLKTKPKVR